MNTVIAYEVESGEPITYAEAAEMTRDLLDELYLPSIIGTSTYGAGRVLEAVDPIAFRMAVLDEIDFRVTEGYWTEEAPADEDDAEDTTAYVGLWHGGSGYAVGSWAVDAEVFDSLDHALAVYEARAANVAHFVPAPHAAEWDDNTGRAYKGARLDPLRTPCVYDDATLTLAKLDTATLHGIEGEGLYAADYIIHIDETGKVRVAEPIAYAS